MSISGGFRLVTLMTVWTLLILANHSSKAADPPSRSSSTCPEWIKNKEDLPLCPDASQASILPETFPTGAIVVSNGSGVESEVDRAFTTSVVEQVVRATSSDGRVPLIVLVGASESTQNHIRQQIQALDVSPEIKRKALNALKPTVSLVSGSNRFVWQQDYFEVFTHPDGRMRIRAVEGYENQDFTNEASQDAVKSIARATYDCGFRVGPSLKSIDQTNNGHAGGNIEGMPGGFCLLGSSDLSDAEWHAYAQQFCGRDPHKRIKVPTSWLTVGHTDEIMKVIKNNNPKEGQCDFSIALSSPQKAIELLEQNPQSSFTALPIQEHRQLQRVCINLETMKANKFNIRNNPSSGNGSQGLQGLLSYFITPAYGKIIAIGPDGKPLPPPPTREERIQKNIDDIKNRLAQSDDELLGEVSSSRLWSPTEKAELANEIREQYREDLITFEAQKECLNPDKRLSNADVLKVLKEDHSLEEASFASYNRLVQEEMDGLQSVLSQRIKSKLNCTPDFIQTPDLFFGGNLVKKSGQDAFELPNHSGRSVLPNSTNSVFIGDSLIIPEPGQNAQFKAYMQEEYAKRGIISRFVDTAEYAHKNLGNLHCTTHSLRICQPRPSRSQQTQRRRSR